MYLPDEPKAELKRVAEEAHRSEAELVREAIRPMLQACQLVRPTLPLFGSGNPMLAERVVERPHKELDGFGEP